MDKSFEKKFHNDYEENHWWAKGRRDIILRLINKNKKYKILDLGCSSGSLLKKLDFCDNLYGVDISIDAINLAKKKGFKNVFNVDAITLPFKDNMFDIIISSDVLEHIENDNKAISEMEKVLKKKGKIIVFVPAFMFLWSPHDEVLHHKRRYDKQELILKFSKHLKIIKCFYWNSLLFFPFVLFRLIRKKKISDYGLISNHFINQIFFKIILFENWLILKGITFPLGISLCIIAEKSNPKS